jgi:chromosome transmission fidelity protein 8
MDLDQQEGLAMEYNVTTIIKEKIVFTNRPRLIVKESLRGLTKIGG